ncbi:exosporium leader peptide-containing protein, partial [Bacillus paranthracis]|nr:exosporium leader peptide-containing protein [Bacillus paranthracis]MED1264738.1 exosporium leader peptide-containing protein [Bacillus paranthracis]
MNDNEEIPNKRNNELNPQKFDSNLIGPTFAPIPSLTFPTGATGP